MDNEYDVVVVGGGAAGLSAALVLGRARRRVAVVDAGTPRNAPAAHMHGFLTRDGLPPRELLAIGRDEVAGYGGRLLDDTVTAITPAAPAGSLPLPPQSAVGPGITPAATYGLTPQTQGGSAGLGTPRRAAALASKETAELATPGQASADIAVALERGLRDEAESGSRSTHPGFVVRLASGAQLTARRVLVTTGLHDEVPEIPGVRERWGRDLLHCPYCHGWEVRDQALGVLGGSADAVTHALLIRHWSDDVVFFTHTYSLSADERLRLNARGVRIVDGEVARLAVADDRLRGVELADGSAVLRSAVFVRPLFRANAELLTSLGCAADAKGWVTVDATGRTSVPGVWAAGNAVDPRAQVITAAGAGSAAAIALNADLVEEEVERAIVLTTLRDHHESRS